MKAEEMFAFISQKSENIISSFSAEGIFTYISPTVHALLGYTPDEVLGKPAEVFNHPEDNQALQKLRNTIRLDQDTERFTGRVRRKNGEYRWYETTVQYIRDASGKVIETIGVGRDITDRKRAEEMATHLAYHDSLTDLPNRRLFKQMVSQTLAESRQGRSGLLVLDLDEFKDVNDTYGHDIGDFVLIEVAKRLKYMVGEAGVVARWGGDEFTVFLRNVEDRDDCARFMERIKDDILTSVRLNDRTLRMTTSIGAALFPTDGESVEALVKYADAAMYREKSSKGP